MAANMPHFRALDQNECARTPEPEAVVAEEEAAEEEAAEEEAEVEEVEAAPPTTDEAISLEPLTETAEAAPSTSPAKANALSLKSRPMAMTKEQTIRVDVNRLDDVDRMA